MKKNTLEQINPAGISTRYTEEISGIPTKYVLGAGIAALGLVMLFKGNKNGKPSFFRQYITPLIMAAAYKKLIEVVENSSRPADQEMPAIV